MDKLYQLIMDTYGIAGIITLSPLIGVVMLAREVRRLTDELVKTTTTWSEKVSAAQQARIDDSKAISDRLMQVVTEQAALNKETNIALDRIGDAMSEQAAQLPPPR